MLSHTRSTPRYHRSTVRCTTMHVKKLVFLILSTPNCFCKILIRMKINQNAKIVSVADLILGTATTVSFNNFERFQDQGKKKKKLF
ncbi:unnamed protein product [Amoebophrya sp. A120]|nr:unnamed protein product [Amoebophrya sp. A120]|eukprot:GSA120T00001316001.1